MYLYVYDQNLHDALVAHEHPCLFERTDVSGAKLWIFAAPEDDIHLSFSDGYWVSSDLHMTF